MFLKVLIICAIFSASDAEQLSDYVKYIDTQMKITTAGIITCNNPHITGLIMRSELPAASDMKAYEYLCCIGREANLLQSNGRIREEYTLSQVVEDKRERVRQCAVQLGITETRLCPRHITENYLGDIFSFYNCVVSSK